jgi:uncharacterized paraquat-inducible protein A
VKSDIAFAPMSAMNNRKEVAASETVGCYHCLAIYSGKEVVQFTDDGKTALCPKCNHDCVLPSSKNYDLTPRFLKEIHEFWL